MLVSCTKKFSDALRISVFDAVPINREPLYQWHANVFVYKRRKGVLLLNNKTRYPVVLYGLMAEHLQMFKNLLLFAIEVTFCAEGFSDFVVARYIRRSGEVSFCKNNDRGILSQMNYSQYHLEQWLENQLPINGIYMIELSKELSRLPMDNQLVENKLPIELLWEELREV